MNAAALFLRADQAERQLCMLANAAARRRMVRALFCSVSRLGDGMAWYALMAMMPLWLGWTQGLRAASACFHTHPCMPHIAAAAPAPPTSRT